MCTATSVARTFETPGPQPKAETARTPTGDRDCNSGLRLGRSQRPVGPESSTIILLSFMRAELDNDSSVHILPKTLPIFLSTFMWTEIWADLLT